MQVNGKDKKSFKHSTVTMQAALTSLGSQLKQQTITAPQAYYQTPSLQDFRSDGCPHNTALQLSDPGSGTGLLWNSYKGHLPHATQWWCAPHIDSPMRTWNFLLCWDEEEGGGEVPYLHWEFSTHKKLRHLDHHSTISPDVCVTP